MVADMTVGLYGIKDIKDKLKYLKKKKQLSNEKLDELIKLKTIEVSNKKPEVMFLYELLEFLKNLPVWYANDMQMLDTDTVESPKVVFVSPKWNGRIEKYRNDEHRCDIKSMEGEIYLLDVNYYINKLNHSLNKLGENL